MTLMIKAPANLSFRGTTRGISTKGDAKEANLLEHAPCPEYSHAAITSRGMEHKHARGPFEVATPRVNVFILSGTPEEFWLLHSRHRLPASPGTVIGIRRARANSISAALVLGTPPGLRGAVRCESHKPYRFYLYPLEASHA